MRYLRVVAVLVGMLLAAAPAAAVAKGTGSTKYDPPGLGGANQYYELIPTSGGGTTTPTDLSAPTAKTVDALGKSKQAIKKLRKLGAAGKATADWAEATAPTRARETGGLGSESSSTATAASVSTGGGSAFSGVAHLLGGSDVDGIGAALPILLLVSLAGAVGYAAGRGARGRFRPRRG